MLLPGAHYTFLALTHTCQGAGTFRASSSGRNTSFREREAWGLDFIAVAEAG